MARTEKDTVRKDDAEDEMFDIVKQGSSGSGSKPYERGARTPKNRGGDDGATPTEEQIEPEKSTTPGDRDEQRMKRRYGGGK